MTKPNPEIRYAAHTLTCTFLLDAEGICRRIQLQPGARKRRNVAKSAARCVEAQYVASLDAKSAGHLVEMPKVGASMLFARADACGRISLVRTCLVTRLDSIEASADPFDDEQVETSAPAMPPARKSPPPRPAYSRSAEGDADDDDNLKTAEYLVGADLNARGAGGAGERHAPSFPRRTPPPTEGVAANDSEPYVRAAARPGWNPPPPRPSEVRGSDRQAISVAIHRPLAASARPAGRAASSNRRDG